MESVSGSRLILAIDRLVSTQTSVTNRPNGLRPIVCPGCWAGATATAVIGLTPSLLLRFVVCSSGAVFSSATCPVSVRNTSSSDALRTGISLTLTPAASSARTTSVASPSEATTGASMSRPAFATMTVRRERRERRRGGGRVGLVGQRDQQPLPADGRLEFGARPRR